MQPNDRETNDGGGERAGDRDATRRAAEKLLLVDELEDTLEQARGSAGSAEELRALERRLTAERASVREMERRGILRYDEMERVMELIDRGG